MGLGKSTKRCRECTRSLQNALNRAEADVLHMMEREMDERPNLVYIGSCVLVALFHGDNLYVLNVGDSRAVLATYGEVLRAVELRDSHTVDYEAERIQILNEHPEDSLVIIGRKVKGKLKVTRAFGVGYLKRKLISPPYVSLQPSLRWHKLSNSDRFLVLASDGFCSTSSAMRKS
ncbi:hypothetical protein M569_11902 [Genlisea aurea]|uniref:PPM-type phosphatase domain-containing protein n=1 Tax=Genlisea aurea TaxID=192259 RepID=S8C813_9LAMI|nr:hypothetical protein M569_11902 [Genlisea aurea]